MTLSLASEAPVTVDYRTEDGPDNPPGDTVDTKAVAGSDYVAESGTLTFEPGETLKTVEVAVIAPRLSAQGDTAQRPFGGIIVRQMRPSSRKRANRSPRLSI